MRFSTIYIFLKIILYFSTSSIYHIKRCDLAQQNTPIFPIKNTQTLDIKGNKSKT